MNSKMPRVVLTAVAGVVALVGLAVRADSPEPTAKKGPPSTAHLTQIAPTRAGSTPEERLREGTEWKDRQGVFRLAGDRVAFYPNGDRTRFVVLENLALDRVVRAMEASPIELRWSVSGIITEFRGTNYLVLRRATVLGPAVGRIP